MQIIKAELMLLGVNGAQMRKILANEYHITTGSGKIIGEATYSLAITGKRNDPLSMKIRAKCMDYISKHKKKGE